MQHRFSLTAMLQHMMPKHWLSRQIGSVAESNRAWLKNLLIKCAVYYFDISLEDANRKHLSDYESFNDFFTRELQPGARPIDPDPNSITSPVDGQISQIGSIEVNQMLQAKGISYSVEQLLGSRKAADKYLNGDYITIYLSPKDYHRVHAPCDGTLLRSRYIPGDLFSVNEVVTRSVSDLFCRNERLVCEFDATGLGSFCVIFVGAIFVAGIETVWGGTESPGLSNVRDTEHNLRELSYLKGEELGRFKFGSTVLLIFQNGRSNWCEHLENGNRVRLGEHLATATSKK